MNYIVKNISNTKSIRLLNNQLKFSMEDIFIKNINKYASYDIGLHYEKEKGKSYILYIYKLYFGSDDVDELYHNLASNSKNKIILSDEDYDNFCINLKTLINKNLKIESKKEAIINSMSEIFAYECYDIYEINHLDYECLDGIFGSLSCFYPFKDYKEEIYVKTKQILKNKYNIDMELLPKFNR